MMIRQSDEELALLLHHRRNDARYVPLEPFADAKPNDCHENARKYVEEHPGCTLICGWLIEQFVGWNYFIAHTIVEQANGAWIDPTPMSGQYSFIRHLGSDTDFEVQRRNRPQVQFATDLSSEELEALLLYEISCVGDQDDLGEEVV